MQLVNRVLALVSALLAGQGMVYAGDDGLDINWLISLGVTFGGDELAEVLVTHDGDTDAEDIHAGELFYISGGAIFPIANTDFSLQTTIGWHTDSIIASNGDVGFDRFPLEVISFYNFKQHRLGAGLTYNLSPELDLDDAGGSNIEFKNALGYLFEYN